MDQRFYEKNGYWIEEGVFSDAECSRLIDASTRLENYVNGTYRPMMMPHRVNALYLEAMRNPKIVASIARAVGGRPVGLQTEFFYCKPGTRGFSLHQDNFFVEAAPGVFASAWCALTDTYAEKGGLIVYPGTHKEGLLPQRKLLLGKDIGQDPNANNEETLVPGHYEPLNVRVPRGAALYIDSHLVHGSNPNQTQEWRHVLLNTYIREGESFRAGRYAQRAPVPLFAEGGTHSMELAGGLR
jgi:ectoine hydroxylase-related dioxygenase (phytanoyl-CoA dioxygenase family)